MLHAKIIESDYSAIISPSYQQVSIIINNINMSTDAENPQGQETVFDDEKGGAENESSSKGVLVYYNTLMRLVMSAFLIAAGAFTIPSVIVPTYKESFDFQFCAVCFIIGTGIFFTCTLIDFMGAVGSGNTVAMLNSSLYILGSLALVIGSIFFYPDVNTTGEPVGQYLYIAGTLTVCSGLLWVSRNCNLQICIHYSIGRSKH